VEVYYRSFKQTFSCRKLRSHKAEHARVELDWAMAGLWAACLYAQHCGRVPPRQLSVATVLRAFRRTIRHAVPPDPEVTLSELFRAIEARHRRRLHPKEQNQSRLPTQEAAEASRSAATPHGHTIASPYGKETQAKRKGLTALGATAGLSSSAVHGIIPSMSRNQARRKRVRHYAAEHQFEDPLLSTGYHQSCSTRLSCLPCVGR